MIILKQNMLFIIVVSLLLIGCNDDVARWRNANKQFIAKYGSSSFDEFENRTFFVRGFDKGNPIVFVYDRRMSDTSPCRLFYGVVVDKENSKVLRINKSALDDTCKIDEQLSQQLALKFAKYNVTLMSVDSNKSVFVKTIYKESDYDLVHFSDNKFVTDRYKKGWKPIGNGWYERLEFE